jgi:hypothetical protein
MKAVSPECESGASGRRLLHSEFPKFQKTMDDPDNPAGESRPAGTPSDRKALTWIIHKMVANNTYLSENNKGEIKKSYEE